MAKEKLLSYIIPEEVIKTNISCIDYATGGGIIPGTTVQLVSESGIGKSTICIEIARNFCNQQKRVLYLDSEGSITKETLLSVGITDTMLNDTFYYVRESTFENVEKVLDKFLNAIKFDLVIIDSIASLISDDFINTKSSITTKNSNINSRPLALFVNKYNSIAKSSEISFIFVNHFRNRIDPKVGTILKEYGCKSVKYNSDIILKIMPLKSSGKNKDFLKLPILFQGNMLEVEVVKSNKMAPGFKIPLFLIYGRGISELYQLIYALLKTNIIVEENSYYKYEENGVIYKRHGFEDLYNSIKSLLDNKEVMSKVKDFYIK